MAPPSNSAAKRRRRKTLECFISKLSEKIIAEIFLNLPIATLMCCRRVCRSWRSILFSRDFNQLRLDRRPNSDVVICRSRKKFFFYERKELALAAVSVIGKGSYLSTQCSVLHLVNSCNGLICMVRCLGSGQNPCSPRNRSRSSCYGSTVFAVNPVTSEYVALPCTPEGLKMEMCALGFCTKTNEFKAFRILSKTINSRRLSVPKWLYSSSSDEQSDQHASGEEWTKSGDGSEGSVKLLGLRLGVDYEDKSYVVEVCTLRMGTWRRIEADFKSLKKVFLRYEECYSFTYVNGSVYWIGEWNDHPEVVSFDFETECFGVTGGGFYSDALGIGAFRGDSLYFCRLEDIDFDAIHRANRGRDVVYDDDDDLNEGDRGVEVYLYKSSCWAEESTVVKIPKDLGMPSYGYPVVKYFENGNILFWEQMGLFLFDKENQEMEEGFSSCEMRSREDVIVHVPTFLSLKDMLQGGSLEVRNVGFKHNAKA